MICAHPGCGNELALNNLMGVCKYHRDSPMRITTTKYRDSLVEAVFDFEEIRGSYLVYKDDAPSSSWRIWLPGKKAEHLRLPRRIMGSFTPMAD